MRLRSVDNVAGLRTAVTAVALSVAALAGCRAELPAFVPDPWLDAARGSATGHGVEVHGHAVLVAEAVSNEVSGACRLPLGDEYNAVHTHLEYVREAEFVAPERIIEERAWVRDGSGDIASTRQLAWSAPDGRAITRFWETRRVNGLHYRALDDRFVDADRIVGIGAELEAEAFGAVDELLGLVGPSGDGWRPARDGVAPACRRAVPPSGGFPSEARVEVAPAGRRGRLVWTDRRGTVSVSFTETYATEVVAVEAPPVLWAVDPDPGYGEVRSILDRGLEGGWLSPGDASGSGVQ